jgi:endogenous inhibitor of DNA gyrase (YacG/DUF329 family)
VQVAGAQVDPRAKNSVTPFQLAFCQNQLDVGQWLVEEHGVDPCQVNDFDCGAVQHWLGICPVHRANYSLFSLAEWLAQQPGIDFSLRQRQGHTPLHKAAWGGHLALIQYLRNEHGLSDDAQDDAGNFAANLADMAHTPHHDKLRYICENNAVGQERKAVPFWGLSPRRVRPKFARPIWKRLEKSIPIDDSQHPKQSTTPVTLYTFDEGRWQWQPIQSSAFVECVADLYLLIC